MEQLLVCWVRNGCQHCTQLWDLPAQSIICLWIKNAFWWSSANLPKGMKARAIGIEKFPRVRHWWPQLCVSWICMWEEKTLCIYIVTILGTVLDGAPSDSNYSDLKLVICNKVKMSFWDIYSDHGVLCLIFFIFITISSLLSLYLSILSSFILLFFSHDSRHARLMAEKYVWVNEI